jgi:phosphoribosylaminoimidazole carboxylase PurE protein
LRRFKKYIIVRSLHTYKEQGMKKINPLVGVVMGSLSDKDVMESTMTTLTELGIPWEAKVSSAHRTPDQTRDFAEKASEKGMEVIIAGAGWAAHLAGVIASYTLLPVIGVPIDSSPLKGMDSLLSTVQMPPGIPVATVAIGKGGAKNAAVLAAQILALKHPDIAKNLKAYRQKMTLDAIEKGRV